MHFHSMTFLLPAFIALKEGLILIAKSLEILACCSEVNKDRIGDFIVQKHFDAGDRFFRQHDIQH